MNEREYNDLMRLALGSDVHWQAQTATAEGTEEIREWLHNALRRVKLDTQARQAEWSATKASYPPRSTTYRNGLRDYSKWRASALRFTKMVEDRLAQLPHGSKAPKPPKPEVLQKAHAHAEYMEKQQQHLFSSLVNLARAVAEFESGCMTVSDLAAKLDKLTVPYQGDGAKTLRTILAAVEGKWVDRS